MSKKSGQPGKTGTGEQTKRGLDIVGNDCGATALGFETSFFRLEVELAMARDPE